MPKEYNENSAVIPSMFVRMEYELRSEKSDLSLSCQVDPPFQRSCRTVSNAKSSRAPLLTMDVGL